MKLTDIAWDFDGCLYDSYDHIVSCLLYAVEKFGYSSSDAEIRPYARISAPYALQCFAPRCGCTYEELRYWYQQKAAEISDLVVPYPELPQLLRDIVAAGGRNHICSNRRWASSAAYLERDGLLELFDSVVGPDTAPGFPRKPEPGLIVHIQSLHGTEPKKLLMIGDRELDLQAAHGAGSLSCFFDPDGYCRETYETEFTAKTAEDLRKVIFG